ncbi:helix-turn-helix transcriptional regulator [Mucilaginibacter sp. ZT4R22]|uniref:Helix-turn-helix transcriptional regulator n=1 Tax=Mucilaginibacter pankratovii TaxID=2772110 RepID=A0ABR7WV99_9SPHI|nr:AraC family transcriptional regulator [Mucilaginibacter pankratovii]MBD1366220.1 helix-turn-helix transcriptional regulator [Mucilaginibacter pankratovii]
MKVLPFTIPVPHGQTIIVQEEVLPHFYPHLHRHAEVQVTWIQEGEGTLLAGNNMHVFTGGEVFVMGANQPHLFKSSPDYFAEGSQKQVRAISVFFNPNGKLAALFNLPEMQAVQSFFSQWQNGFKIPERETEAFSVSIAKIQHSTGAAQLALLIDLLNAMSTTDGLQPLSSESYTYSMTDPEGARIASVYNYIMHNYSSALTLDEVARLAHLTPNAFCRYFKKHTRTTFIAFVNKVRVNEACKMLVNGSLNNIADVAYSCGFSSITNFNYVFKNIAGKSPRDYINDYSGAVKTSR